MAGSEISIQVLELLCERAEAITFTDTGVKLLIPLEGRAAELVRQWVDDQAVIKRIEGSGKQEVSNE